ncbi:MAG: hypothetical protein H0U21_17345 [Acidimicrobiia bacterium]|nr:hypothetical protein [Acidimicrobiia bacterium]
MEREERGGYDRFQFRPGADLDDDGCDTRSEVLNRDTLDPAGGACPVLAGSWRSAYDGLVVTDLRAVEIDHVVSLKEAWDSGAWSWTSAQRVAFANDLIDVRTLRAVTAGTNQAKGDRDPSN